MERGSFYVLQTGTGTMEFPANQIAEIVAKPDVSNANPLAKPNPPAASFDEMLVRAALGQGLVFFVWSVARGSNRISVRTRFPRKAPHRLNAN